MPQAKLRKTRRLRTRSGMSPSTRLMSFVLSGEWKRTHVAVPCAPGALHDMAQVWRSKFSECGWVTSVSQLVIYAGNYSCCNTYIDSPYALLTLLPSQPTAWRVQICHNPSNIELTSNISGTSLKDASAMLSVAVRELCGTPCL